MFKIGLSYTITDSSSNVEAQVASVRLKGRLLTIINIYIPPDPDFNADDYKELVSKPNSLILGDLNAYSHLWGGPIKLIKEAGSWRSS